MPDHQVPAGWLVRANRLATIAALLSATAHEVNNALQVISGNVEMLRPDAPPDVITRRGHAIGSQAQRATTLLAELSAFARDDIPEPAQVDLHHVARRALAMRQYTLGRLRIASTLEAGAPLPVVAASTRALLQIVLNLMLNAERALTGRQGGQITVTVSTRGDRVELTVDDNGPGIAPDAAPRLFQPAMTDVASVSGRELGIGLAVGRWLAERHRGTLDSAPSALGGAAFTLSLPAV